MSNVRSRLTFANVASVIALFVALGGSSYAALTITGKDVRNGTLTGADLRNNSVKSADIANRSLLAKDFKRGQLVAGAPGPQGPRGERGEPGPAGEGVAYAAPKGEDTIIGPGRPGNWNAILEVPPGDYTVHANAILRNISRESFDGPPASTAVHCIVGDKPLGFVTDASQGYFDEAWVQLTPELETGSTASVVLAGVGTVEGGPLFFQCGRPSGFFDAVELTDIDLFAIKVGALHRAPAQ